MYSSFKDVCICFSIFYAVVFGKAKTKLEKQNMQLKAENISVTYVSEL